MPRTTKHLKEHQFKKGAPSPNPAGRPPISPEQRALRKITIETYREVIEVVLTGNLKDLKAIAEDPASPAIQVGIAVSFMKAIKSGDYHVIEKIAERIIGKIPDVVNVNNTNINAEVTSISQDVLKKAFEKLQRDV